MHSIAAVIATMLKGRLGNQMFQYAAGRALAERHRTELVLDTSWMVEFRRGGGVVENELAWGFALPEQVRPVWEIARLPNPRHCRRNPGSRLASAGNCLR